MKFGLWKFRILLRALCLGLAAVFMWKAFSIAWQDVPVELPAARSSDVLVVTVPIERRPSYFCDEFTDQNDKASCLSQLVFDDRDMSIYDNFGQQGCSFQELSENPSKCERSLTNTRRFVWEHWKNRTRGYVAVSNGSDGRTWTRHLFIEPNEDGKWRITEVPIPLLREPEDPEHYRLGDLIEVKWETAGDWETRYGLTKGTKYLRLENITGDGLIL
ncbi:MAG: hypothetical protein WBD16_12155 [Pyrinomonadaceae bacterium]